MKQGTLINRIVMLLLLAAVLVYLGVSAWRSFRDPYTLVLSYAYTVDDSLEATGFLVREESVLASPGGIVDLLPEEGEKVSRGETVALLYQNDSGLARKEELQSLTMEKEQLQYALERTQSGGDSSQLSQQVIDAIVALRSSVSTGDLTRLEDETLLLKSLVYKRDFTFNGGEEPAHPRSAGDHHPRPAQPARPPAAPAGRRRGGQAGHRCHLVLCLRHGRGGGRAAHRGPHRHRPLLPGLVGRGGHEGGAGRGDPGERPGGRGAVL